MASIINEELMKTNLDIPEGEIKIEGQVNPVYADAINVHNKKKKDTEKALKDKKPELKKPFLGTKGDTTIMPKSKGLTRLKLSEDMFKEDAEVISPERKKHILQDKRNNRDFWSDIYNELANIKALEAPHRRLKRKPSERYDSYDIGMSIDGAITVSADTEEQLDFAKEVAETYGVEYKVVKHDTRTHNKKFTIKIYPERIVTNESLDDVRAFGRKANKKTLKESANSTIYSKVVNHFEYSAPGETLDTVSDIVDRAMSNIEDGYDIDEAVMDALDNGLIYHKDLWAIKHYYEDSELLDGTFESLYNDVYSIVSDLAEDTDDIDEGLTSAQRHNRKMDKIFDNKKNRDVDMVKFIKANSDTSEEEIKKAQDDDKVGLLLKNKGLHDKYWAKNESLNESYTEVDTIECGEDTYRVVGGGFNTRDALVSVEDKDGNKKRLSSGDVIEFYTWYDKKGNVIHEPSDDEE